MKTLLSPDFRSQVVTPDDLTIASICWGFTLGFGFLTTWTAMKQCSSMYRRYGISKMNTPYVWMIWLEILVCLSFSIICWMHIRGYIGASFAFYFCILTLWALQVQFLLQIIINRVSVLMLNRRKALYLKLGVAALITLINIAVYCIWVPARLEISETYIRINAVWDRCEKVIYLIVDAWLNYYFIRVVRKNLVKPGLKKYQPLVRFNMYIIGFSLAMDVLIIGMMSLENTFVYMQFHPLAYIVKLNIEMSMAELISSIARTQGNDPHGAILAGSSGERSGLRSVARDEKRNTTVVDQYSPASPRDDPPSDGMAEEMEMGILKNSGPPNDTSDFRGKADSSRVSEDSETDDESMSGTRFEIHKKHEVHVRIENARDDDDEQPETGIQVFPEQGARNEQDRTPNGRPTQASANNNQMGVRTQVWGTY